MKNERLIKPLSVARNEFINDLTNLINSCMLPPFIIEDILKDTYSKVCAVSKRQLETDIKQYESSVTNFKEHDTANKDLRNEVK